MLRKKLKERKKKKLRQLNLSEDTWRQLGEIYSHVLVNRSESVSNEEIISMAVHNFHRHVVRNGGYQR